MVKNMNIDRQYIINEFKRISEELGKKSIPRKDFLKNSDVSEWHILRLFGSYNEAVIAAGLKPIPKPTRPAQEEIFEEMFRVFSETGGVCSALEFGRKSKYSRDLPARVFGSWDKALLSFAEWMRLSGRDIQGLSEVLKRKKFFKLTMTEETSQIKPESSLLEQLPYKSIGGGRYGSFINFRGLQHAPINEQGVVFLFGMICFELGFAVEAIRPGFPDCEAKRRIDKRKDQWERVRIEFEFQSRSFRDHGHNPADCDLIVCWEHDWPECPLEVIELKTAIQSLSE
jgi:hypothetical protein